jgi:cob(I)alamin adenosyltransferase
MPRVPIGEGAVPKASATVVRTSNGPTHAPIDERSAVRRRIRAGSTADWNSTGPKPTHGQRPARSSRGLSAAHNASMPRLDRIYTKTGDEGMTGLGGGQRVAKDSLRVEAYGTVDELNSHIGVALAIGLCQRLASALPAIQNQLFDLGADLATPATSQARHPVPTVQQRHIEALEHLIDELNEVVGPLTNFLLPGGSPGAAQLHVARTVCRRAERTATTLARDEQIGPTVLPYLNRLSDALFVMARYENHERGVAEPLWEPGA